MEGMETRQARRRQETSSTATALPATESMEEQANRMSDAAEDGVPTPSTRAELIAEMRKEAKDAQEERELQRLRQWRETGYAAEAREPAEDETLDAGETHAGRRGSSPTDAAVKRRKTIRDEEKDIPLPIVKDYKGDSYKEFREWERALLMCFETRPTSFEGHRRKILFGRTKLAGTASEAWARIPDKENYTWDEFLKFLKKQITSDASAAITDLAGWRSCTQGSRTVGAVVNELDDLESRMDRFPESTRTNVFILAMRPALRRELMRNGILPADREAAIAQAMTLETAENDERKGIAGDSLAKRLQPYKWKGLDKSTTKSTASPLSGVNAEPTRGAYAVATPLRRNQFDANAERKKQIICHHCHKKGHYKTDCLQWQADSKQERQLKDPGS